jgi:hypothetical protein
MMATRPASRATTTWIRAIALGAAVLTARQAVAQGIDTGVRGGVNLASTTFMENDGATVLTPGVAPVVAVFATLPLPFFSWLELQPEAQYSVKSSRLKEPADSSLVLDYVEAPVLARISRGAGNALAYYFIGGASFAYGLRARSRTDFGGAIEEIDIGDEVERFDLGAVAGFGFELGRYVFDGRYTHGLRNIDKDATDAVKVTSRTWSVTAGFRF